MSTSRATHAALGSVSRDPSGADYVVARVCARITRFIKRDLIDAETQKIRRLIYALRLPRDIPRAIITISDELIAKYRDERIDVHELLNAEISADNTQEDTAEPPPPPPEPIPLTCDVTLDVDVVQRFKYSGPPLRRAYLALIGDDATLLASNRFQWTVDNGASSLTSTNARLPAGITGIVKMRLYPLSYNVNTTAVSVPDPRYDRMTILIEELSQQSVVMRSARKYHWMFRTAPRWLTDNDADYFAMWDAFPAGDDADIIEFHDPVRELTTITLALGKPDDDYAFVRDDLDLQPIDFHIEIWYTG
jgi:post-segregation antitoxin (ccd killing protein)